MKKIAKLLLFVVAAVSLVSGMFFTVSASESGFEADFVLQSEYALGETVELPSVSYNGEPCRVSVQYQNGESVRIMAQFAAGESAFYTFGKTGSWYVVYEAVTAAGVYAEKYDISVAEMPYIEVSGLAQQVSLGSSIARPAARLTQGGAECGLTITCPDGTVYPDSQTIEFDQVGIYKFTFTANDGTNTYTKTQNVECTLAYGDLFYGDGMHFSRSNTDGPDYAEETNGVLIEAAAGSSVRFRNPINLSSLAPEQSILAFHILNDSDTIDYNQISIVLTDVYDSSNQVTVTYIATPAGTAMPWNYALTYMMAGTGGIYGGYSQGNLNMYPYGSVVFNSFHGARGNNANYECYYLPGLNSFEKLQPFNFGMDMENGLVTTQTGQDAPGSTFTVIDLYDSETTGIEWEGFATGEVYMDIVFPASGRNPRILVTEVAGESFSGDIVNDRNKPVISIASDAEYGDVLPDALTGAEYSVPAASATDTFTGSCPVVCSMVNVSTGERTGISSGTFVPETAGEYRIEYVAEDVFGNSQTRSLYFEAKDSIPEISVIMDNTDFYAGVAFKLPEFGVRGGSGRLEYTAETFFEGEAVQPDENGYFLFEKTGAMTLKLTVKDYLGTKTVSEQIDIVAQPKPVLNVYNVPVSACVGETLYFGDFTAADYLSGKDCYTTVYVNGMRLEKDRLYTVKEMDTALCVEYIAISETAETVKSYNVNVYQKGDYPAAFAAECSVEAAMAGDSGFSFTSANDFAVTAPSPLTVGNLRLEFRLACTADRVDLLLYDYFTRSKAVRLSFTRRDGLTSYLQINGKGPLYIVDGGFNNAQTVVSLTFNGNTLVSGSVPVTQITEYEDGRLFDGFGDGKAIVQFRVTGNSASSSVYVYRLANQSFISVGQFFSDSGPVLRWSGAMRTQTVKQNHRLTVYSADSTDVFTGGAEVRVTVTAPSGIKLLDGADCSENRTFVLTEFGRYSIEYTATDDFGNRSRETFIVTVADSTPPDIVVTGSLSDTYRAGDSAVIPRAFAVDFSDPNARVIAYIYDKSFSYKTVTPGERYTFEEAGEYTLVYLAYDETLNFARHEIKITVTEK